MELICKTRDMDYIKTTPDLQKRKPGVRGREADRGPIGQRDPLDSDTETGEKLVAGEARRRRSSTTARSPGKPRASTCSSPQGELVDPRGLAGVNGGSAALRAVRR